MAIGSIMNTATLTQTFDGEFNNGFVSSPDGSTGLWQTSMMNGNRTLGSNGEEEYYSDSSVGYNPFSVQNGTLDITAQPTSVVGGNALGLPYDSGVITTESSFNQLYGYFEIDAKLPAGQGLWPAFWLLPASGAWPPELDVFEVLGNAPSTLYFSTHSGVEATDGTTLNVANTSSGFNLYGVMWGPQTVDLYINNVEVASMPTPPDMDVPMYMLANLAVGGYWPGDPNSTTPFPATMQIAYMKAFAYPGTTGGTVYDTLPSQNIGAAPVAPTITSPGTVAVGSGVVTNLGGISVAANWPGGDFTVMVSDSNGLLNTSATNDVFTSGEDTTTLTLQGNLAAINAALATLTYAGTTMGDDWIWVGATDPQGQQGTASVVADVGATSAPAVTTPSALSLSAGTAAALSGIGVTDSQVGSSVTLVLTDTTGLLATTAETGVTAQGEDTTKLTLTGSLAAINAELATLTYKAGSAAATDSVAVAYTDAAGEHGFGAVSVTVTVSQVGDTNNSSLTLLPADSTYTVTVPDQTIQLGGGDSRLTIQNVSDTEVFGDSGNDFIGDSGSGTQIDLWTGSTTVDATGGGPVVYGSSESGLLFFSGGARPAVVYNGSGAATVFANSGGGQFFAGNASSLLFVGGSGASTVVGGAGTSTLFGGSSGRDLLVAGTGASTVIGEGSGVAIVGLGIATDDLIAGSGTETLVGSSGGGGDILFAGTGSDALFGGTGNDTFVAASGGAQMIAGSGHTGQDEFIFSNGAAGNADVLWNFTQGQDHVALFGYGANAVANALASAVMTGGSTVITLSDSTQITFAGVTDLKSGDFL